QLLQANEPVPKEARFGFEFIDANNMKAILNFLASDELEGRATGNRGLKIAAKFLASQYKLAGLTSVPGQDSMLQKFFILQSSIDTTTSLSVSLNSFGAQISYRFSLNHDFWMPTYGGASYTVAAPVVFAGYGLKDDSTGYNDFKGLRVKGKILMVFADTPEFMKSEEQIKMPEHRRLRELRKKKVRTAQDHGAVAILMISKSAVPVQVNRFKKWHTRPHYTLTGRPQPLPQFIISEDLADAILSASAWTAKKLRENISATSKPNSFLVKGTSMILDVKIHAEIKETQNVVAYLQGSDPEVNHEVIALGAHYDHLGKDKAGNVFNGADDDGSGTTAMLEIARAFAKNPIRPRRSLLFISHCGEERGLLGSDYYTAHPLVPLKDTIALLNMDMIGRNNENSVYIIGSDFLSRELHEINEAANATVGLELDYTYNSVKHPDRFYYRSDHYNFAKQGIPIIFYFAGLHRDYHKATDTVDKINFAKMQKIGRLVYLTAWKVANLEHRLTIDRINKSEVD
ncbi:MAG: M28 family peptidase, partial [bacterium]